MYSPKLSRFAALAAAATLALAGCGGDDGETEAPALEQLSQYLPADAPVVTFVDLAAVREELELPADADPFDFEALRDSDLDDPTPEALLVESGVLAMPLLTSFVQTLQEHPASEEFDGTKITAAANTFGDGFPMAIIKTEQSFDEIAEGLVAQGWREEGDVVIKEGERFEQVADGGDGVIIVGRNEAPADVIADKPAGGAELVDLLEPADQPIQAAANGVPDDCVDYIGGWESPTFDEGTIRFHVDGTADADSVVTEAVDEGLNVTAGEPTVDGEFGEIPYSEGQPPMGSRIRILLTRFESVYDCG